MKQIFIFLAAVFLATVALSDKAFAQNAQQGTFFLGGSGQMGYGGVFNFSFEPIAGYEFNDRWAIGTGLGVVLSASGGYTAVLGIAEPFLRFCVWHNDLFFIDLKATGAVGFNYSLQLCQLGIRPSLRFRLSDHCDMAADIGLFGAQYTTSNGWQPAIGLTTTSIGLWFAYRF